VLAVCEIVCQVRNPNEFGVRSARQLAFFLKKLRSQSTMKTFFLWYTSQYRGDSSGWDNVFKFLRSCEYGLPQIFSVVQLFAQRRDPATDYNLFTAEMNRWFRPEVLKNLDEQGVPIQISERFLVADDTLQTLSARLVLAASDSDSSLTVFERRWVLDAIPLILTA
jgi:hypothetical protein